MSRVSNLQRLPATSQGFQAETISWGGRLRRVLQSTWPYFNALLLTLLGLQYFLLVLNMPCFVATWNLDPSWHAALTRLCMRHAQAGVDFVFTYGPLGMLECQAFIPEAYWPQYVGKLILSGSGGLVLALLARQMRPAWSGYLYMLFAIVFSIGAEGCNELIIVGSGLLLLNQSRWRIPGLVLATAMFATLSLMKLTYIQLSIPVLLALTCVFWVQGERWKMAMPLGLFAAFFLIGWIAIGQQVSNLSAFYRASVEMVGNYSDGMSIDARSMREAWRAATVLLICFGAAATCGWNALLRPKVIAGLAMLAAKSFLDWKHGFVRHDLHCLWFFLPVMQLPFLLLLVVPSERWLAWRRLLMAVGLGLSLYTLHRIDAKDPGSWPTRERIDQAMRAHFEQILHPQAFLAGLVDMQSQEERNWDLPRIREKIGQRSVDLLGFEQGVLILNHLNWQPRPVFQSYSTYSGPLLEMNGEYFRSDKAPDFVLWALYPIDSRFPSLDDSQAVLEILHRYKPVMSEKRWVLFERVASPAASRPKGTVALEKTVRIGETVSLEQLTGRYQTLAIDIDYSVLGQIQKFLLRPDFIYLKVRLEDDEERSYRLIPKMTSKEFLLNPFCESTPDFLDLYTVEPGKRIVSLSLYTKGHDAQYVPEVRVTVREYPELTSQRVSRPELGAVTRSLDPSATPTFPTSP